MRRAFEVANFGAFRIANRPRRHEGSTVAETCFGGLDMDSILDSVEVILRKLRLGVAGVAKYI